MTAAPESPQVETAIRDRRAATIDELGQDPVLWLAAPPVWSLGVAEGAEFPVSSVGDFVRRASAAGLCKVRGSLQPAPAPDLLFWMPDEIRREVMDVLRARLGADRLSARGFEVAGRVESTLRTDPAASSRKGMTRRPAAWAEPDEEPPGALRAWSDLQFPNSEAENQLERLRSSQPLVYAVVERTAQAVERRDLEGAQDLVAAAEALAAVLAGSLEQALSRARRLLALGLQRRQDERTLGHYQDRPELTAAVTRLLRRAAPATTAALKEPPGTAATSESAETSWALHLRGAGGVGKTMLIRYLASGRYATARGLPPIPVARADFDHISPDYPVRRPVQLLLELADELALHTAASDRADQALTAFRTRAARAHEAVSGLREAGGSPLHNPEVARAVEGFGIVLDELGDVVLILDTCEELAKADLGDPASPAVRATLDIIERLHERAPSMRVLFAGRRPLPARRYLAVQPVAGFTVAEARDYLGAATRRLPAGLADAMIRQSPAVDGPVPPPGELPARVSPFDLALYAAWADEDPDLGIEEVERGSDAYIEGRIIERLDDPLVVRALPVLAVAGRCRVETVAELMGAELMGAELMGAELMGADSVGGGLAGADPAALGRRLAEQEWIDADGDPPVHVTARPALALRLRRYFNADERRAEFAARSDAVAAVLLRRLRDTALADIDVDELIAALRLAPPADAAVLWDAIAEQATLPPGRWGTVLNMTRRILGEWDEEEWPTTPALRATVVAAHIAASRRDSPLYVARGDWKTVSAWADRHPDPVCRQRLLARAALGMAPNAPGIESPWRIIVGYLLPDVHDELAAAAVDAAHRMLESGQPVPRPDAELLQEWAQEARPTDPWIRAWAAVARARLLSDTDSGMDAARTALADAEHTILRAQADAEGAARVRAAFSVSMKFDPDRGVYVASDSRFPAPEQQGEPPRYAELSPSSWPDWIPPDDLLAQVRIEHGLIAPPDDLSVLDEWEAYATPRLGRIDGEPLASLCLRIRLRHGVIVHAVAERWESDDTYVTGRSSTCTAHDLVPPLFVSVAQAWLAAGQPDRALALLDRRRAQALGTRQDEDTVQQADAAMVLVIRRFRLTDQQSLLLRLADGRVRRVSASTALQALRTLGIVDGPSSSRTTLYSDLVDIYLAEPHGWHAWWQSTMWHMLNRVNQDLFRPRCEEWRLPSTSAEAADMRADLAELRLLSVPEANGMAGWPTDWDRALTNWLAGLTTPPPTARSADPNEELRAALRLAALAGDEFMPPASVPRRLVAEMAFEEAELTALRLAEPAARLFIVAADAYAAADDAVGTLLARLSIQDIVATGEPGRRLPSPAEARRATHAALLRVTERDAELATMLAGPQEDAGRWRYWAEKIHATEPGRAPVAPGSESPRPDAVPESPRPAAPTGVLGPADAGTDLSRPETSSGSRAPRSRLLLPLAIALAACSAALFTVALEASSSFTQTSYHPGSRTSGGLATWTVAVIVSVAALAALLGWYVPKVVRLGRGRGIGAVRPGLLLIQIAVTSLLGNSARLDARLRPWRTAPLRARAALGFLIPGVWLVRLFLREVGYGGALDRSDASAPRLLWRAPPPTAGDAWWRKGGGSPLGVIRPSPTQAESSDPFERIVTSGLGDAVAGRVEWIRLVYGAEAYATYSANSVLLAPAAWGRVLAEYYAPSSGTNTIIGLRHVVGRAAASSAGPVMEIAGPVTEMPEVGSSPRVIVRSGVSQLLSVNDVKLGQPAIVILQAEPGPADTIGPEPPDDQAEKLRLGADLAADGVPAVLLLPVLPDAIAGELTRIIAAHMRSRPGPDAQVLLTRLRKAIAPRVPPAVLDDVVLFLNETRYRS